MSFIESYGDDVCVVSVPHTLGTCAEDPVLVDGCSSPLPVAVHPCAFVAVPEDDKDNDDDIMCLGYAVPTPSTPHANSNKIPECLSPPPTPKRHETATRLRILDFVNEMTQEDVIEDDVSMHDAQVEGQEEVSQQESSTPVVSPVIAPRNTRIKRVSQYNQALNDAEEYDEYDIPSSVELDPLDIGVALAAATTTTSTTATSADEPL